LSDKLLIRSNSPEAGNKNTSAKSENDKSTYNNVNLGLNDISKSEVCRRNTSKWKKYLKQVKILMRFVM
ncbi:25897_t:CDS:1, partial [Gigaspora rosea]